MDQDTTEPVPRALLAMQRQSWEQGVAAHALLDLGRDELAVLLADAAVTRQHPDGRVTGVSGAPDFARPGTSAEAQAFHLLAHAALRRATGQPRSTSPRT
jgi:unsaturated rhamnogalacturonyl hydrolase